MDLTAALQVFALQSMDGVSADDLKHLYHTLAQAAHPDKGGSAAQFIRLQKAYKLLKTYVGTSYGQDTSNTQSEGESATPPPKSETGPYSQAQFSELFKRYEDLWSKYTDLESQRKKEQITLSDIIAQINLAYSKDSSAADHFHLELGQLEQNLSDAIIALKKRRDRKWWEYIVPVPKLSEQEYIRRHNELIDEFNRGQAALQRSYRGQLLSLYRRAIEQCHDILSRRSR